MFRRYRFTFDSSPDQALASLDTTIGANPGFGLRIDIGSRVKIFRSQGFALLNGFFPIFVGRLHGTEQGTELRGGFRFHVLAIALFAGFVGISLSSLLTLLVTPETAEMLPDEIAAQRIWFELQFIAFAFLAAFFAWLAGKPMRDRIESIIRSSTAIKPGKR